MIGSSLYCDQEDKHFWNSNGTLIYFSPPKYEAIGYIIFWM